MTDDRLRELIARSDGTLPSYAWPGGYAIAYVVDDGELLCRDCAGSDGHYGGDDDGWRVVGYMTADWHDVGEGAWTCAHCNVVISEEVTP